MIEVKCSRIELWEATAPHRPTHAKGAKQPREKEHARLYKIVHTIITNRRQRSNHVTRTNKPIRHLVRAILKLWRTRTSIKLSKWRSYRLYIDAIYGFHCDEHGYWKPTLNISYNCMNHCTLADWGSHKFLLFV